MTKSDELLAVEAEHGFVFGDDGSGESAGQSPVAALACPNPVCDRNGQLHQIHADTVLPVRCGECNTVLHCQHNLVEHSRHDGTYDNPVRVIADRCTHCGAESNHRLEKLPPIPLGSIPLGLLGAGVDAILNHIG